MSKESRQAARDVREKGVKALVSRFAYHGTRQTEKGYMLHFSGHRADFPTADAAHFLLQVETDGAPETWNPDWWPVALLKAFNHFRHCKVEDIQGKSPESVTHQGTVLPGLPKGEV